MSHAQQDPAAATAPFDSRVNGVAVHSLTQGKPSDISANDAAIRTLVQGEPREIAVVAKKFAFEPARIEVTEGERIRLTVSSADGVHGIAIKAARADKKVPRGGDPVTLEFTAPAPGDYPILCSEYCGNGHESMKGMLVVVAKPQ